MKAVLQRVTHAEVVVDGKQVATISQGFLVLIGMGTGDTVRDLEVLAKKIVHLRVFSDQDGKMNLSLADVGGEILAVSQFTLYADCKKGRRPSFVQAMAPVQANQMFEQWVTLVREMGVPVQTGIFGADMNVSLCNQGPVTIVLDSTELQPS